MSDLQYYKEAFDEELPPPSPPNRDVTHFPFVGFVETKESKKRTSEYEMRLKNYHP
jgi:hypothetical protein